VRKLKYITAKAMWHKLEDMPY